MPFSWVKSNSMTVDEDWKNNKHHWEEMGCLFFGLTHNAGALILYNTVIVYSPFIHLKLILYIYLTIWTIDLPVSCWLHRYDSILLDRFLHFFQTCCAVISSKIPALTTILLPNWTFKNMSKCMHHHQFLMPHDTSCQITSSNNCCAFGQGPDGVCINHTTHHFITVPSSNKRLSTLECVPYVRLSGGLWPE